MTRRVFSFLAVVFLALAFVSCSDLNENASVSFTVPAQFFADQTESSQDNTVIYTVNASIIYNGIEIQTKSVKLTDVNENELPDITFKSLPAWKEVQVKIEIYKDNLKIYQYLTPSEEKLKLKSGPNKVDLALKSYLASPLVYVEYGKNDNDITTYTLKQRKSFDCANDGSDIISASEDNFVYAFDNKGGLWVLKGENNSENNLVFNLTEYLIDTNTLEYSSDKIGRVFKEVTISRYGNKSITLLDMYYDNETFYILTSYTVDDLTEYWVCKSKMSWTSESSAYTLEVEQANISTPDDVTVESITRLAVKDGFFVFGAKTSSYNTDTSETTYSQNIFYGVITKNSSDENVINVSNLTVGSGVQTAKKLAAKTILVTNDLANTDYEITDLQFGDGLGAYKDKLFILLRLGFAANDTFTYTEGSPVLCSAGALVEVDFSNLLLPAVKLYGNKAKLTPVTYSYNDGSANTIVLGYTYCPEDNSNFWGPQSFAGLISKKLLIADNGMCYDSVSKKAKNNDSLFEFDMENALITQGAAVKIWYCNHSEISDLTDTE